MTRDPFGALWQFKEKEHCCTTNFSNNDKTFLIHHKYDSSANKNMFTEGPKMQDKNCSQRNYYKRQTRNYNHNIINAGTSSLYTPISYMLAGFFFNIGIPTGPDGGGINF